MTGQPLCPWCEEPVDINPVDAALVPTRVEIPTFGQIHRFHPVCGARLLNAGLQHRPRAAARRRHPAHRGLPPEPVPAPTVTPGTGDPWAPRLTLVRKTP